jgi:hypothetical protein
MTRLRLNREVEIPGGCIGCQDPRRWKKLVRQTARQAQADLKSIRDAAADEKTVRPPAPTADYCLLAGCLVRWEGKAQLPPLLWHVLEHLLLRKGDPFPLSDLEEAVWGPQAVASKTVPNTLSRLNKDLLQVQFPWTWRVRNGHVWRDG